MKGGLVYWVCSLARPEGLEAEPWGHPKQAWSTYG